MASDSGVFAGTSLIDFQAFCFGSLLTNPQMYLSNVPNSSFTARNSFAFWIAASIFSRLRMIPESDSKLFRFFDRIWRRWQTRTGRRLPDSSLAFSESSPNSGPPALLRGSGTRTGVGRRGPAHPIPHRDTAHTGQSSPTGNGPYQPPTRFTL